MTISMDFVNYIDIFIGVYLVIGLLFGAKRGFILGVIGIVSSLIGLFLAIAFAPTLATEYTIIVSAANATAIEQMVYSYLNVGVWFVLIYMASKVVLGLLGTLLNTIFAMPILSSINKLLGAVLGVVSNVFTIIIIAAFLCTPIIKNGQEIVDNSLLQYFREASSFLGEYIVDVYENTDAFDNVTKKLKEFDPDILIESLDLQEVVDLINKYDLGQ